MNEDYGYNSPKSPPNPLPNRDWDWGFVWLTGQHWHPGIRSKHFLTLFTEEKEETGFFFSFSFHSFSWQLNKIFSWLLFFINQTSLYFVKREKASFKRQKLWIKLFYFWEWKTMWGLFLTLNKIKLWPWHSDSTVIHSLKITWKRPLENEGTYLDQWSWLHTVYPG